jgi:hypothetical protein
MRARTDNLRGRAPGAGRSRLGGRDYDLAVAYRQMASMAFGAGDVGSSTGRDGDLGAGLLLGEDLGELVLKQLADGRGLGEQREGVFEVAPVVRDFVRSERV